MGKKTKHPFLSKNISGGVQAKSSSSWPWRWPSACQHQPRTLSFRTDNESCFFKTVNSAYLDAIMEAETPKSRFSNSSEISSACFSTASDDDDDDDSGGGPVETVVIRGLRSERLFFKPGKTSSILEEAKPESSPFKDSTVLSMESQHPFVDFRNSMDEMVEAHGLKDWEGLEELLSWYLRANGKSSHGYIIGAFIDLLVKLAISSTCNPSCSNYIHSPSSPLSFYTSSSPSSSSSEDTSTTTPCPSLKAEEEIDNTSLSEAKKEITQDKDDV